jgi:hypothetical protein
MEQFESAWMVITVTVTVTGYAQPELMTQTCHGIF